MTRIAVVHKERCNPAKCQDLCMKLCPVNRTGSECIVKIDNKAQIDEALCTGCGICQNRCPFDAIAIINLPEELKTDPIHRYGPNGFALYSLPVPRKGKVVGIIGKNGIGKSTAIKILAGVEKPNLGKQDPVELPELIDYFRGSELQGFIERLQAGEETVSYKPQHVDMIPKTRKGKIADLLGKVDEQGKLQEIAGNLEIENILDHDISKVSGGELQRIAIAAAALKKATLYIFDEPTSYLDIKQRLKISRFIRNLADENTAVLIIEHDLIVLDYMTDLIHIMYGKDACYGIVSQPRSSKAGINTYLDGFLREENIRFRDKKISFDVRQARKSKKTIRLTEWPELGKTLGSFQLNADPGEIHKEEIVGIIGENGIGKTSFIRLLAGVEKPDTGSIDTGIKVSYKPQYIDSGSDQPVMMVLRQATQKYTNELINPLNLKHLMNKPVNELSGGELQRVAIAEALAKDCDLVLLDEPSAYLDVEQRLLVSKVIENISHIRGISIMTVDHDLLFIDYLSERLLVFDGKPAVEGTVRGPFSMEDGMNKLLSELSITLRREEESGRPRMNKEGSQKDVEQKNQKKYYYS